MKILSVTQSYYPFLDRGGPTVKVRAIAHGLANAGHEVTVLTADLGITEDTPDLGPTERSRWGVEAGDAGVRVIYLRTLASYRALTWNPGVPVFCQEHLRDYDLVHIYGLYDLIGARVAMACRGIRVPYLVEPMGMFRPIVRSLYRKRLYHTFIGRRMLAGARRIVATAEQEKQELLAGGLSASKIVVRRNGIEVPEELPALGTFRDKWGIARNAKLILFLGRLVSKKSPDLILEAFSRWQRHSSRSSDSLLVLAGPDENDGFRKALETTAANLGLNGGVLFTGPLYGQAKWAAYRDADLFVLPSVNENFGNTAAEAIACGTPVLVTDQCGIAPIVNHGAGLVVPHDCAAMEAGLHQILDNTAVAARLRTGCTDVARLLTWETPLSEMHNLYMEILAEGTRQ